MEAYLQALEKQPFQGAQAILEGQLSSNMDSKSLTQAGDLELSVLFKSIIFNVSLSFVVRPSLKFRHLTVQII